MRETLDRQRAGRPEPLRTALPASGADRAATRFVGVGLFIAFYYLAYRYPLQINSSTTSPSYSDTPPSLQMAKYGIFALLTAAAIVYFGVSRSVVRFERSNIAPALVLSVGFIALWPLAQTVVFRRADLVESGVFFVFSAVLLAVGPRLDPRPLGRLIAGFTVVAVLVNIIQVALYLSIGRLPALAYAGTTSIRFGSLWDDPNGFAAVIALLIPVALLTFRRWRVVLALLLLASLGLTQSVTGIVASLAGLLIVWVLQLRLSSSWLPYFLVVVFAGGAIEFASLSTNPFVASFLQGKAGSVQGHLDAISIFHSLQLPQLLGVAPMAASVESGYVDLIGTEGVLFAMIYVAVLLALAVRSHRNGTALPKGDRMRGVHFGISAFSLSVAIGLTNLPLQAVFPVNALLAVCLVIAFCTPTTERTL